MEQVESEVPAEAQPLADSPRSRRLLWWAMLGGAGMLLCGLAVMAGLIWNRGRIQQGKVQALERFDASIHGNYGPYQYTSPIPPTAPAGATGMMLIPRGGQRVIGYSIMDEPAVPTACLAALLGEHCFTEVHDIHILSEQFSDADVPLLLAFPELRVVDLWGCPVTDAGVRQLLSLKHLMVLNVADIPLSKETLRQFAQCRELKELDIAGTGADEETLEYLRRSLPGCLISE